MPQENNPDAACAYGMYVHTLLICMKEEAQQGTAPHGAALRFAAA